MNMSGNIKRNRLALATVALPIESESPVPHGFRESGHAGNLTSTIPAC